MGYKREIPLNKKITVMPETLLKWQEVKKSTITILDKLKCYLN